jgi:hypothetical protein
MSQSRTRRVARVVAAAVAVATLGTMLGGCAQMYWDRRDAVALSAGDAIAANEAMQTIDPWPARSSNSNLAFNGQRMQSATERYRTNTVIQPLDPMTMQVAATPTASQPASNGGTPANSTSNTTIVVGAPATATTASQ